MNKLKYFSTHLEKACQHLNMEVPHITQDNRMGRYMASTVVWFTVDKKTKDYNEVYIIKYNLNVLNESRKIDILDVIFHELGHIKFNHPKEAKNIVQAEYEAEKFALESIKKYYKNYYLPILNSLKRFKNRKRGAYKDFYKLWQEKTGNNE